MEIAFPIACRQLLEILFENLPAQRAFFLVREAPTVSRQSVEPLQVIVAHDRESGEITPPVEHLDHHYLFEVGAVDGARLLPGSAEGGSRPLLTCSFALAGAERGLVLLDAPPSDDVFDSESAVLLEDLVSACLIDLRWLYAVHTQRQELARVREELRDAERRIERHGGEPDELPTPTEAPGEVTRYHGIVTRSASMQQVFEVIDRVKDTDLSTLIVGETGTGKELVARAVHYGGNRATRPFEVVGCGSLTTSLLESELFGYRKGAFSGAETDRKGVFERAHGGTVFLDEVADMPTEMQKKILRVLQEKVIRPIGAEEPVPIDVRVIASTREDLAAMVQQKTFREDLFYRLNVITIDVPPVRERRHDIPLLIEAFLRERSEEEGTSKRFSESALRELQQYVWPGNVQELKNVVTRAFLISTRRVISRRVIMPLLKNASGSLVSGDGLVQDGDHLTLSIPYSEGFNNLIGECEKLILLNALRRNRGNKSRVTQQLRIPRQTLYNKLEKYGIVESDYLEETEQV